MKKSSSHGLAMGRNPDRRAVQRRAAASMESIANEILAAIGEVRPEDEMRIDMDGEQGGCDREGSSHLPVSIASHRDTRRPEVSEALRKISRAIQATSTLDRDRRNTAMRWIETLAVPYVLSFYHEIHRLDAIIANRERATAADRDRARPWETRTPSADETS